MKRSSKPHRIATRAVLMAALAVCVVVSVGCAVFFYFACILPAVDKAATFDLSRLADPGVPPDAIQRSIPVSEVPPHVLQALISREDPRFYQHDGNDYVGMGREFWGHLRGREVRGSRTITQQLAQNAFDLESHSNRHLLLLALARRIEQHFAKAEILEFYLNRVYFGLVAKKSVFGIEAAAQVYFVHKASDLNLVEGATLVGLIRSPERYSPFRDPKAALAARNVVLHRMAEDGWITKEGLEAALREPLRIVDLQHVE